MERTELQGSQVSPSPATGQPWLASRLLHRQVVNASTIEPLGRVTDILFDPKRCRLAALSVQADPSQLGLEATIRRLLGRRRATLSIAHDSFISLNGDVVIVDLDHARPAQAQPSERAFRLNDVCGLTIITLHGLCLGTLTDVLLDDRGGAVSSYVIRPTKQAEHLFTAFEEPEPPAPHPTAADEDAASAASPDEPPAINLRIIPASPRVRFGDSLIMLFEEVEPLVTEPVVIAGPSVEGSAGLS